MIPRRHSPKLPTISSIGPITIRAIQVPALCPIRCIFVIASNCDKPADSRSSSGYSDNDDSRLLQQGPITHYYSWTLPAADVARPIVGGQKFDGVFLCSKIFRTPNQKNPDGHEKGLAIRA